MEANEVKATTLKEFFEWYKIVRGRQTMDAKTFMTEWKILSEDDRQWYKAEYAKMATLMENN